MYKPDYTVRIIEELRSNRDFFTGRLPRTAAAYDAMADWVADSVSFMLPQEGFMLDYDWQNGIPVAALELIRIPFPRTFLQWTSDQWDFGVSTILVMEFTQEVSDRLRPLSYFPGDVVRQDYERFASRAGSYVFFFIQEVPADGVVRSAESVGFYLFHPNDAVVIKEMSKSSELEEEYMAAKSAAIKGNPPPDYDQIHRRYQESRVTKEIDKGKGDILNLKGSPILFHQELWERGRSPVADWSILDNHVNGASRVLLDFCLALNCSNVQSELHQPPEALNRKRRKNGKLPFSEYRTLVVEESDEKGQNLGGSHSSPRFHLRRGHIRMLASGKAVWVRAHSVGDPSRGTVRKNYQMQ